MTRVSQSTNPTDRASRRRPFGRLFMRDRSGATAIEFAMLALPFSLLLFAILESCISFAAQQVLSNAADDIARQLRTGQIRASTVTEPQLKSLICERIDIIVTSGCPGLVVDLRQFTTFEQAAAQKIKYTPGGDLDTTGFQVKPGPSMSRNMLRVFYKWPVMTDFMRSYMTNLKGGYTLHFASVTWQNEPFDD
jgi:Flp pilus assembly protein TadG